jgi:uncharacterized protein YbjT (DUF2867 family)
LKLLIFGSTGGTGAQLLIQAFAAGHDVTVFVRKPDKISVAEPLSPMSCGFRQRGGWGRIRG